MTFEDLLPELLPEVKGAPAFLAINHLRKAARDFCERTHIWMADVTPFNTVVDQTEYTLALPTQSSVVRLFRANVGDEKGVALYDEVSADAEVDAGSQSTFVWLAADKLRLNPVPIDARSVELKVSLRPSLAATSVPDWIAELHSETLVHGAKWTLFAMADVDWSNPTESDRSMARFLDACSTAARQKTKGRATAQRRRATLY